MNRLDRMIAWLSPEQGARRARARASLDVFQRHGARYEGAQSSWRNAGWRTPSTSANAETFQDNIMLRDRARDLVRNNPWAKRAIKVHATALIGTGLTPKLPPDLKGLPELWGEFTSSIGYGGTGNFISQQTQFARCLKESGEVLAVPRRLKNSSGFKIPFQIQLLEPDFIDEKKNVKDTGSGGYIEQGVEFDSTHQRIGYWIFDRHPGDGRKTASSRFSATDIGHYYEIERIGQVHGVTCFAPVLVRARDLDEYEDAELLGKKTQACFAAFVTSPEAGRSPLTPDAQTKSDGKTVEKIEPASIMHLLPGESVEFGQPPSGGGFTDFMRSQLRAFAAGVGMPYELLTGDLSQVNYSSIRAGLIQFREETENLRQQIIIPFCQSVWREFAILVNELNLLPGTDNLPLSVEWTTPRFFQIDPLKETLANKMKVRNGFTSHQDVLAEEGYDAAQVLKEIRDFNEVVDGYGLRFDSDPRHQTNSGAAQDFAAVQAANL